MSTWMFTIMGQPVGQGSMTPVRAGPRLAVKHPRSSETHRRWMVDIMNAAWGDRTPLDRPVRVVAEFAFQRPRSHHGKRGLLRSAPVFHTQRPDVDKLLRLTLDALTLAGVIGDDARVVEAEGLKRWCSDEENPKTRVWVHQL